MLNLRQIYNRTEEAEGILKFLANPAEKLLLVTGESGSGKSITVEKALTIAQERGILPSKSILSYRFDDPSIENEAERFPQFLLDSFAKTRPSWPLESWMRSRGASPESWAMRLPFATFNYRAPSLRDPYKADLFFAKFAKTLGKRYMLFKLENAENFGIQSNLATLEKLANQQDGPKLLIEIGTLNSGAEDTVKFFQHKCRTTKLEVGLFNSKEAAEYFRFVHEGNAPSSILETSHGNALAIRHYGTAFEDLPVGTRIRRRLNGFSPNAMIFLWCLAALRGSSDIEFLKSVTQLGSNFEQTLIELRQADVVRLVDGSRIKFAHSLFARYFLSDSFVEDLKIFGRQRVISHLKAQKQISILDGYELARQFHGLGDDQSAWEFGLKSAYDSYQQENFRTILDIAEVLDGCEGIPQFSRRKSDMLLLQTAIRTGDARLVVKRMEALEDDPSTIAILLRAQGYYLTNRFEEAIKLCSKIASYAGDSFLASRALGIRSASFVALGRHSQATDDFAAARQIALATNDDELDLELLRLSPEIELTAVWKTRFDELKASNLPDRYPYLYAKCLHNFGTCMLLESGGKEGVEELTVAASVFEAGGYPEYSYSAVMSAATMLLDGQAQPARTILENAEIWCHEQYDSFAFKTNYGVAAALDGDWKLAINHFVQAKNALAETPFPLTDPYFHFQANHNLAIGSAALGQFDEAIKYSESVSIPKNCHDYDFKVLRQDRFLSLLRKQRMPLLSDCPSTAIRWTTKTSVMELATLQFFDFNVNVLPQNFI